MSDASFTKIFFDVFKETEWGRVPEEGIARIIFDAADGDFALMNRLIDELVKGFGKNPDKIKYSIKEIALKKLIKKYGSTNGKITDVKGFVEEALKIEGIGVTVAHELLKRLGDSAIDREPSYVCKLISHGAAPSEYIIRRLYAKHRATFKKLIDTSPAFVLDVCSCCPELITKNDVKTAISKLAKEGKDDVFTFISLTVPERFIDKETAAIIVAKNPSTFFEISEKYLTKDFLRMVIRLNPHVVRNISDAGNHDIGKIHVKDPTSLYKYACQLDGMVFEEIPEYYQLNYLLDIAIKNNPDAMIFSGSATKQELLDIIQRRPELYAKLPAQWRSDEDMMLHGLKSEGNIEDILRHPDLTEKVALKAVGINGRYLHYIHGDLRTNGVIIAALKNNEMATFGLTKDEIVKTDVASLVSGVVKAEMQKIWIDDFIGVYRSSRFPARFSDHDFVKMVRSRSELEAEIIASPLNPKHPNTPVDLFVYPISDWNGAFKWSGMHAAIESGHKVAYYEPQDMRDLLAILVAYIPLLRDGDTITIGGHGTKNYIDVAGGLKKGSNVPILNLMFIKDYIKPGVNLILESCSNGSGGPYGDNIMMFMYRLFDKKWHIYAVDMGGFNMIVFNENGLEEVIPLIAGSNHLYPNDLGVEISGQDFLSKGWNGLRFFALRLLEAID